MSRIDELIESLCPDGVEYKALWELTIWDKRFNRVDRRKQDAVNPHKYLLANELDELETDSGDVKLLTTSPSHRYTTAELAGEYLKDGEIVCIPWGGNANIQYYSGCYVTSDNRIATSRDTAILSNRYLFYCFTANQSLIESFYRGSGIKHPDMVKVLDMRIPVPPMEVQEEVVRVLDAFSEGGSGLLAALEAELEARRRQYAHYRDELLDFAGRDNVRWMKLGDVCASVDYRGKTPKKVSDGILLVTAKNIRKGYIDYEASREYIAEEDYASVMHKGLPRIGDLLITTEAPCGNVALVDREDIALAQRVIKYSPRDDSVDMRYLKHVLLCDALQRKLEAASNGGTVKSIRNKVLSGIEVPIPPLEEQERIVDILDKFDALVNDISQGIPAEIEARRKQYEHYRDKLLSFKEKIA